MVGGTAVDRNHYVVVTAYNVGDRPTTIVNLGAMYFDSWWHAYVVRRKPSASFIVTTPSQTQRIPYRFDVGDQWLGMAIQSDDIEKKAREGYLFLIVYTSGVGRGHRVRVQISVTAAEADDQRRQGTAV